MSQSLGRRQFVTQGCACGGILVAGSVGLSPCPSSADDSPPSADGLAGPMNGEQVMAVLSSIDRSGDAGLIATVFAKWGYHCFHSRPGLVAFAEKQRSDLKGYLDYVNSGRARFWERIEIDKAGDTLTITGRKTGQCACPYAQCSQPAKALCTHCCKALQTELFRCITGRDVEIRVDEAILLGDERCSTTARLGRSLSS